MAVIEMLSAKEVASMLSVTERTLRAWRDAGSGPKWVKVGKVIRYQVKDLLAWLEAQPGGGGHE